MEKRNLLLSLMFVFLIVSCKEDTTYQLQVFIKNDTAGKVKVRLFPNEKYMNGSLYDFCDFGGGYADTTFVLEVNEQQSLYISSNLNQKPNELTSLIFDSIYVKSYDGVELVKFSHEKATGSTPNLFKEESEWSYELKNYNNNTSFSKNPVESHDYIFKISN